MIKKNRFKYLLIILIVMSSAVSVEAQSVRGWTKQAKKNAKNENYTEAIININKAIQLDDEYYKSYLIRADIYRQIGEMQKVKEDYKKVYYIHPALYENVYNLAKLNFDLGAYKECVKYAKVLIENSKKYRFESYEMTIKSKLRMNNYSESLKLSHEFLEYKNTEKANYFVANSYFKLAEYEKSLDYYKHCYNYDNENITYLYEYSEAYFYLNDYVNSLRVVNELLTINDSLFNALIMRSKIYAKKIDYYAAIEDVSKAIRSDSMNDSIIMAYFYRGNYYASFNKQEEAIKDLSYIIAKDPSFMRAYFERAKASEKLNDFDAAVKDYRFVLEEAPKCFNKECITYCKQRMFDLQREENAPKVYLVSPELDEQGNIAVTEGLNYLTVKGRVNDESEIYQIKVNGNLVMFERKGKDIVFEAKVLIDENKQIMISVSDVYHNSTNNIYPVIWTETDPPVIELLTPFASTDGSIYLEDNSQILYIEGTINDESLIRSIKINGENAFFVSMNENPKFTMNVSLKDNSTFTISAEDVYGNISKEEYQIIQSYDWVAESNQMEKSWVVIIENEAYTEVDSTYIPFDVAAFKQQISKCQFSNVIHQKNLPSKELKRFMNITLRDLLQVNNVRTLLLVYAGKTVEVDGNDYWLPIDGDAGKVTSLFPLYTIDKPFISYALSVRRILMISNSGMLNDRMIEKQNSFDRKALCGEMDDDKRIFASLSFENEQTVNFQTYFGNRIGEIKECIHLERMLYEFGRIENTSFKYGLFTELPNEGGQFLWKKKLME